MLTLGRILFAVLFIFSGATKLFDIAATAQDLSSKVIIPAVLSPYTDQIASATQMTVPQLLAISAGVIELVCGLLIALNFGARFFAIVLVFFVIAATYYGHNFWDAPAGPDRINNMVHALKNLSLIGALLMIAGLPRYAVETDGVYQDV